MKVKLNNVRLSFPDLWQPRINEGGKAKFGACFLVPNNHPQIEEIKKAMKEVAKEKWGSKSDLVYKALEKADKLALHDGDIKAARYPEYAGHQYLNASNAARVPVFDIDMSELSEAHGKPYSGCWVNAVVDLWAQDHKNFGQRINTGLMGVQFLRDDTPFSGGRVTDGSDFVSAAAEPSTTDAVWGN